MNPHQHPIKVSENLAAALFLMLAAFLVYANSLQGEFVWDDRTLFIEYGHIWRWENIGQLLTIQDNLFRYNDTGFYRPLVNLTFLLDNWFWGLNPTGYHLTNIILHILATLLVHGIAKQIAADKVIGFLTGLFFALHPIHTEAVAWINGRNNLVSIVFYLAAFYCYLLASSRLIWRYRVMTFFFLACSIFSKEYAVTFPLVIFLHEISRIDRFAQFPAFLKKITPWWLGCLVVFIVYWGTRALVLSGPSTLDFQWEQLPQRLLTLPQILISYFKLLIFPVNLTPYHTIDQATRIFDFGFLIPFGLICFLTVIWVWSFRKSKLFFFALSWIWVTLLPVINLVPIPFAASLISERHLYLPSVGFCLLLAALVNMMRQHQAIHFNLKTGILGLMIIILAGSYAWGTVKRNRVWQTDQALWKATTATSPTDFRARCNLAIAYARNNRWQDALPEAEQAVRLRPELDTPHFILAVIRMRMGQNEMAEKGFERVLSINPHHPDALKYLNELR